MADFVSCRGNSCQGPIIPNTLSQEPQASFAVIVCEPLAVGSAVSWQFHYDFEMLRRDGSGAHAKVSYLCVKFSLEKGSIKTTFLLTPHALSILQRLFYAIALKSQRKLSAVCHRI